MAKTALRAARFPACAWPYAASYACVKENIFCEDGCESAWLKTHRKGEFPGPKIKFGARVCFKPCEARPEDRPSEWQPDSVEGVFAAT